MTGTPSTGGADASDFSGSQVRNFSDECQAAKSASNAGRSLASNLMGGKNADPNVEQSVALAVRLELLLRAIGAALPGQQKASPGRPQVPAMVDGGSDLATLLSAASRDAKYLKRLTQGGIGMSRNVQEPLRVVQELRHKLALIQKLRPDLQGQNAFRASPRDAAPRKTRHDRILDELIAGGEIRVVALRSET
jgi:hypothetical protein